MRALFLLLLCLVTGCERQPVVDPPVPADLAAMDPDVRARIEDAVQAVHAAPRDADPWVRLGMTYEAHALFEAAKSCYEQALRFSQGDARTWYRLAIVQERTGSLQGALDSAKNTIDRDPSYGPVHWRRGFWLLDAGDVAQAIASFTRSTELAPADPAGWIGLSRAFLRQQDPARARDVLQRLLEKPQALSPRTRRYAAHLLAAASRSAGAPDQPPDATSPQDEPVWSDPWANEIQAYRTGFNAVFRDAVDRSAAGDCASAAPLFEQLREKRPKDVTLLNHLAVCYIGLDRVPDGIAVLTTAAAIEPDRAETHLNLASAHLAQDDLAGALAEAERALQLDSRLSKAYEVKGAVLARQGRQAAALEAFSSAVRYNPQNTIALVSVGMLEGSRNRLDAALASFERALQIDPTDADACLGLAMVKLRTRQWDDAEAALRRAAALRPDDRRVQDGFSQLAAQRGASRRP